MALRFPYVEIIHLDKDHINFTGDGLNIITAVVASPFGDCFMALCELGICYLGFPDRHSVPLLQKQIKSLWPKALITEDAAVIQNQANALFFADKKSSINVLVKGTPFQLQVWQALVDIPVGRTSTYADIASVIQRSKAYRAVGTAVGKNPVSYLIPCHRVLPQTGGMGNYLWGSVCKRQLLEAELLKG
jgi:AraC family transcriptional regulator of adaptative response/methylated-DNA-[protein]-cysteine methyltransferase